MESLYEKLTSYSESDYYGFHMPGHKRNTQILEEKLPYQIDITEIEGFDDLHHADGILKEEQLQAAKVYHADETYFLINGSTAGILSAIMGSVSRGEKILVARNCHKSVYHAIFMKELMPIYLYPEFYSEVELNGEIQASDVELQLEMHPDMKAVVIVSPTYDGVISDIQSIADVVHAYGIPLIVDEAHGAHFGFHSYFSDNANTKGADIVIHSLHKTLPSLTQTALIHMNGDIVNRRAVKRYLDMLQTSSPSYVLMASIDACIRMLNDSQRDSINRDEERLSEKSIFISYVQRLSKTREKLSHLQCLKLIETEHYDKSKIVISVKNVEARYTSKQLYQELLDTYHLQMEMTAGSYVLAMTSVGDTEEGMDRLVKALFAIDEKLSALCEKEEQLKKADGEVRNAAAKIDNCEHCTSCVLQQPHAELVYTSAQMNEKMNKQMKESVKQDDEKRLKHLTFSESIGHISTEYAYVYPPGIPFLVPGERVTTPVVWRMTHYRDLGFRIEGLKEENKIEVWING